MKQLTEDQALVVSGYTGVLCLPFATFHEDIEKRLGRPVWTHEMASHTETSKQIKEAYRKDFMLMIGEQTDSC